MLGSTGAMWSFAAGLGSHPALRIFVHANLMTALAGFVDAVGYAALGHLYVSFMSGNSTQLGMAIARGDLHVVGWAGAVITCFVAGSFLGALIHATGRRSATPRVLAAEMVCIAAAASLNWLFAANVALLLVSVAMGMQNAIREALAGAVVGKSFVTGALFGAGDALARALLGSARLAEAGANAASWGAFVAGVTAGALTFVAHGMSVSLLVTAGVVLVLMMLTLIWPARSPETIT